MSADLHTELVEQLIVSVGKYLRLEIRSMFVRAEAVIAALPESCGFSEQICIEANKKLQLSQENVFENYMLQINDLLRPATFSDTLIQQAGDLTELLTQEEVDAMVIITEIHASAMNAFGESVQQLETRLEYLEITSDVSFDKNSLSPKKLCEAFYETLVATGINSQQITVLLKLYDQTMNRQLSEMYETLNALLIEANVLPKIIMASHSADGEVKTGIETRTVNYYNPLENKAEHFIERSENELSYFAANYMNGDMTISSDAINLPESFKKAPSYDEIQGKNCYARKDVVVALSKLQEALMDNDTEHDALVPESCSVDIGVIKSSLFNSMNVQQDGAHVNLLDERSIDFVGMMFDVMANDDIIPTLIKAQLMRLQISVIKVSITDKTLFENDQHPVRNVLNLITELGQGIVSEEEDDYKDISSVITKLLKEYYMDIISFKRAEKELKALLSRKEATIRKTEQEEQRKIIKEHARNVVLTELKCLSAKKTIPKAVQPLVLKYLPTIMINQYVLHGRDSAQWKSSTALLKQLIQCLQPLKKNDDWLHLRENGSALIHDLKVTLCKTSQDKQTIQALLGGLKELFHDMIFDFGFKNVEDKSNPENLADIVNDMEILEVSSLAAEAPLSSSMPMSAEDQSLSEAEKILRDALTEAQMKISGLPEQVHPGVWFEIYNGEEHAVRRLKLSVILNDTAKVIFSDRKGNTVMEKDAGEFAKELAMDKSRVIADHSTFDNALGCVIASLVA